ncbi:MAG: helix-turn-helix domain-containing protein [Armatimonadetes bacterium]|nr:helix-turn-helix domain-containing protein [Armatimonadota bacterium]MBS1727964.1 AraC family transcriptional regulator [Armatimonadota bacterium]
MRYQTKQEVAPNLADLLNQILRSPLSVVGTGELAQQCGYSRSHLTRVFHEMCGESLGDLHRRIRLERAAYGLREGFSVQEASMLGGFGSPEAFCRAFKRTFGLPPRHFLASGLDWKLPSPDGLHWNEHWDETFEAPNLAVKYETKLERIVPFRVAAIRHVGNYAYLWEGWEKVPFEEGRTWVTIYRDNLWTCPNKNLMRAELGFLLPSSEVAPPGFETVSVPSQLAIKTKHFVERNQRNEAWSYLSGAWPNSSISWDEYAAWPLPFEKVRTRACLGLG